METGASTWFMDSMDSAHALLHCLQTAFSADVPTQLLAPTADVLEYVASGFARHGQQCKEVGCVCSNPASAK